MFTPDITEKQELMASRIAMAVRHRRGGLPGAQSTGIRGGYRGPGLRPGRLLDLPGADDGHLFQVRDQGGRHRRHDRGIGVTLFYVFQHKGIMFIPGTAFLGDTPANWFMGIEPNAFGVIGAIVNFAVAFGVSRVTAAPPEEVQHLVEHIRVPAGATTAHEH